MQTWSNSSVKESSVKQQPWPKMKESDPEEDYKAKSVGWTCFGSKVGEGTGLESTDTPPAPI